MQPKDKDDSVRLSARYEQYCFAKRHLRGTSRPKVFPFGGSYREVDSSEWEKDKPRMLSEHRTELGKKTRKEIRQKEGRDSTLRGKEHKEYRPNSHELANCLTTGKENIEKWVILQKSKKKQKISLKSSQEKMVEIQHFEKLQRDSSYPQNQVYGKDLTELKEGRRNVPIAIRRLTPTECERLQGFPDGWTEGVSDTQRYKTLGNAVTVNVVREVVSNLFNEPTK